MLDISVAYNKYSFLGNEFLTWLWFLIETRADDIPKIDSEISMLTIGNRIVLENRGHGIEETVTIKGDDAGLEEGMMALRKGAFVTELNLAVQSGEHEWRFTLKGESFHIANLRTPETGPLETRDDLEGFVLEKLYLQERAFRFIDSLFQFFIRMRITEAWSAEVIPQMKKWISASKA